ncbi:retrotransposable element Tf2 [Tanacetum coccineum]
MGSHIFMVVDRLSKYAHFIPLSHPFTTAHIAQVFLDAVYKLHCLPKVIMSDRDKVFVSLFWKELFEVLKVSLHLSIAYHPQIYGQTKVVNRCLECYLICMSGEKPKAWAKWVSLAETLAAKESIIQLLQFHSERAQQRMKAIIDAKSPIPNSTADLPQCNAEGEIISVPIAILNRSLGKVRNSVQVYVLVQCSNGTVEDALWELHSDMLRRFPDFQLDA